MADFEAYIEVWKSLLEENRRFLCLKMETWRNSVTRLEGRNVCNPIIAGRTIS
jgi:hypothetical protein